MYQQSKVGSISYVYSSFYFCFFLLHFQCYMRLLVDFKALRQSVVKYDIMDL